MFLPTTPEELKKLGWNELDVILVTGDSYIDSSFIGVSVIGKVLLNAGFRVGIIAQPCTTTGVDIARLGHPRLFWGVTGGCVGSKTIRQPQVCPAVWPWQGEVATIAGLGRNQHLGRRPWSWVSSEGDTA